MNAKNVLGFIHNLNYYLQVILGFIIIKIGWQVVAWGTL